MHGGQNIINAASQSLLARLTNSQSSLSDADGNNETSKVLNLTRKTASFPDHRSSQISVSGKTSSSGSLLSREGHYHHRTFSKSEYNGLVRPSHDCSRLYQHYLWEENKLKSHVERIVNVKHKVDCSAPRLNASEVFNLQKLRELSNRMRKLDEGNREMVRRLSDIMTEKKKIGNLDCWNHYKPPLSYKAYARNQARIHRNRENTFMLERIMAVS